MLDDEPKASRTEPTMQLYEFDPVLVWTRRLALYARWRMWMPEWGPRPDQVGCGAPNALLDSYCIRPSFCVNRA